MQDKKFNLLTIIVTVVFVGAIGFFAGMQYQKGSSNNVLPSMQRGVDSENQKTGAGMRQGGQMGGTAMQGRRPVSGEIVSVDSGTLTVKTDDGGSKIVIYSSQTTVTKATEAAATDLKAGIKITVSGSEGTDGTVTAQSITIGTGLQNMPPAGGPPDSQEVK